MTQNLFFLKYFEKVLFSLGFLLVFSASTDSQIIYTDVSPDCTTTIASSGSQSNLCIIDFDNNGTHEYSVRWDAFGANWFLHLSPRDSNNSRTALKGTTTNQYGGRFIKGFSLDEPIGSSEIWDVSMPEAFIGESTVDSNLLDLGDKYVGVRFKINSLTYYGWILLNFSLVNGSKILTIKSYAYNTVADQSILAGQTTSLNVNETKSSKSLKIYPNPVKKSLNVERGLLSGDVSYEIFNAIGQIIENKRLNGKEINVSKLKKGVYFIKLYNKEGIIGQQKFIKS